jgi:hypothetical protein
VYLLRKAISEVLELSHGGNDVLHHWTISYMRFQRDDGKRAGPGCIHEFVCFVMHKVPISITNVTKEEEKKLLLDETLVLLVCLVPVAVFFLWLQLLGELLKNCLEQLLLTRLVLCIPVPHRNLDRIPAD